MAKKAKAKSSANGSSASNVIHLADMAKRAIENCTVSAKELVRIIKRDCSVRDEIDTLVADIRLEIGNAVEKHQLNKTAYARAKALYRYKSSEKLAADWLDQLAYMHHMGILARIEGVKQLPLAEDNPKVVPIKPSDAKPDAKLTHEGSSALTYMSEGGCGPARARPSHFQSTRQGQ